MKILHVAPTLPPNYNGLGDYASQLSRHWQESDEVSIAALSLPSGAQELLPSVELRSFSPDQGSFEAALVERSPHAVILHYVGYGYAKRGAPLWIPAAIRGWKQRTRGTVVVVFHELYASGPIWKSEFWFGPAQKRIVRDLAGLADAWITSCDLYRDMLLHEVSASPTNGKVVPVPSNIIPPATLPRRTDITPQTADLRITAFGLPRTRLEALRIHQDVIRGLYQEGRVRKLLVMGASPDPEQAKATTDLVGEMGLESMTEYAFDLSSEDISKRLLECDLGLVFTRREILGKSGVFAACSAHGVRCFLPGDPTIADVLARPIVSNSWAEVTRVFQAAVGSTAQPVPAGVRR